MKKTGFILISSMLLLMNSCSETLPLEPNGSGGEVAVRFTTTMQPTVEVQPTRAMIAGETLPEGAEVGIFGMRTQAGAELPTWEEATFHRQMKNKQYLVEAGNTLSPWNGELDYHPMGDSLLTVCAYMPYSETVTADGYLPVNLGQQTDILYTGTQTVAKREELVTLPFKHALGAVAFRFYTDNVALDGTNIASITLTLNYNHANLKLFLADGTFDVTFVEGEGSAYPIYFGSEEAIVSYSFDPMNVTPVGHTMLVPGDEYRITKLSLIYSGSTEPTEKELENPITVEAGKLTVLGIKCQTQSTLPSDLLQLDKSTYATRTSGTDNNITFEVEEDYIE